MSNSLALTATPIASATGSAALPTQIKRVFPPDRSVPQLIAHQARENPGHLALGDGSIRLTYGELDDRANQLAHRLKEWGVAANTAVAVCVRRSPLAALASLAVMKAGAAYLPIDPNYPRERLSFILSDSRAPIVLSDSTVAGKLPEGNWRLLLLDREDLVGRPPGALEATEVCPDHLAYVIYTSGSTGTPKGVEITHRNLLNFVLWHRNAYALTANDRTTQFTSFGFDAAVGELWPHLAAGASVLFTPEEVRSSPELLRDWLIDQEITLTFVPTPLAERLIMLNWPASTKLRLLLTGGDTLHHYPRSGLPFVFINEYGPTETTVAATCGYVLPENGNPRQHPPIGRPIDGAEIYIVDESLNLVPRGEIGELCIGGAGVGRGYVNSPELTAKKFVADPFINRPGARMYRTGDQARWLMDGQIEYLGRLDDQIKIRGYRIEPNEIIAALNTHPAVQASAVIARQDGMDSQSLVAYIVVTNPQPRPTVTELRDLLLSRVPDYMIPAMFVVLPDLPLSSHGKLDRKALPPPDANNTLPDGNYLAPRTVLEEKISELVANLLGVAQVGVNDNLFLIGGHSLFGTQLIARLRDNFGVELPLRGVFESPTPALLAQEIERLMATKIGAMSDDEIQCALKQATSAGGEE